VRVAAHVPLLVAGGIGLVGLVGYASGLNRLYWQSDVTTMAIPTAAGISLLVTGALVLAPVEGVIAVVMRSSPGGRLLRRLLPVVVLAPTALLVPIGRGAGAGWFGFDVGVLLFLIGTIAVSLPVVFWTARTLDVAEARAREEAERFSSVLRAATEQSIIGTDVAGVITVFNEGAERMLGYTAEEVVGHATPERIHDPREIAARARELGVEPGFEAFVGAARHDEADTREWTYIRKDGGRVPVALTVTALRASDGSHSGFMGVAFDLSARKELERELRRQADFTGTLVGSAPVGIFATDTNGACIRTTTDTCPPPGTLSSRTTCRSRWSTASCAPTRRSCGWRAAPCRCATSTAPRRVTSGRSWMSPSGGPRRWRGRSSSRRAGPCSTRRRTGS
jgi:PAS domain S-box-containing protein